MTKTRRCAPCKNHGRVDESLGENRESATRSDSVLLCFTTTLMGGGDTTEEEEESDNDVGRAGSKNISSSGALMASIVEHEEVWEDFDEGEVEDDEDEDEDEDGDDGKGGVGSEAGDSKEDPKRNLRGGSHKGSLREDSSSEDEEDADQEEGGVELGPLRGHCR